MALKKLGSADLAATTPTTIYTCPSAKNTVATVRFVNRNAASVTVRLCHGTSDTPAAENYLEYDVLIPGTGTPNNVLEATGIALAAGEKLVAYASGTGVTAIAYGVEE